MTTKSRSLTTGQQVRHKGGDVVTLAGRKFDDSGWWLMDNRGGLADCVLDRPDSDWTVLDD
jgi:hypothetical protein